MESNYITLNYTVDWVVWVRRCGQTVNERTNERYDNEQLSVYLGINVNFPH